MVIDESESQFCIVIVSNNFFSDIIISEIASQLSIVIVCKLSQSLKLSSLITFWSLNVKSTIFEL